jgi:hypothetical protein
MADSLYDFRSKAVHGRLFTKNLYRRHIRDARDLARKVVLWFLYYINQVILEGIQKKSLSRFPSRTELLQPLDYDNDSRTILRELLNVLPKEFPSVYP